MAKTGLVLVACLLATILGGPVGGLIQPAKADFIASRAFREATGNEFERVFLTEVSRSGDLISVGPSVEINAPLIDQARVWTMLPFPRHNALVYGVFDPQNTASLDGLFVVRLGTGQVVQLNPDRADPVNESILLVANAFSGSSASGQEITSQLSGGASARVVYVLRNANTSIDQLFLADVRNPGTATLVAQLPTGSRVGTELIISPDGSIAAYSVEPASGSFQVVVTFLNQPSNNTVVYTNASLTDYRPVELTFSDDSSRLMWIDSGAADESGPLQSLTLAPLSGEIGEVQRVSSANVVSERVSEFAVKPGSNLEVAYRSFPAGSSTPSDTYLADLSTPNVVTQLNDGPVAGAAFTTWEDVLWRSNSVLYNAAEAFLELADLFTVAQNNPGNPTSLSRQVPFSIDRTTNQAAGVSHFVLSPDNTKTAMIDGDPALNLFVIDQFNIGAFQEPFDINENRALGSITDPADRPPRFNPNSDMIAMVIAESIPDSESTENLYVAAADADASEVPVLDTPSPQVFQFLWFENSAIVDADPTAIAAAVLPASRSGQVGSVITAFVTLLNGGATVAEGCGIDLISNVPATLSYQTTNPVDNAPIGVADQPVDIAAGGSQSFVITLALNAQFNPRDAMLSYTCRNAAPVVPLAGVNTLLLSASTEAVADVIALAATVDGDGIVRLDNAGNGAFSVASINVGAPSTISVVAESTTGASIALCQTNPNSGACTNPSTPSSDPVTLGLDANETPTFSVFVSSSSSIAADASSNRINLIYRDQAGTIRGQSSVAVQSTP